MKRILLFLFSLGIFASELFSQGLNIGVVVPEEDSEYITASAYRTLNTKLEKLINGCGATSVNSGNIVMFPVVDIVGDNLIEGGMRNIYSLQVDITVKVVSLISNTTFGSITWELKGNGYSKTEAAKNAFNKISVSDEKFKDFYKNIKIKIENYYVGNRATILAQAKKLAAQKKYEQALAMLYEYPSGISGDSDVQSEITKIYKQYQIANCSQILQEARAQAANKNYDEAVALIAEIDATSSCASDAKALSTQIRNQKEGDVSSYVVIDRDQRISNIVAAYNKANNMVQYKTVTSRKW